MKRPIKWPKELDWLELIFEILKASIKLAVGFRADHNLHENLTGSSTTPDLQLVKI